MFFGRTRNSSGINSCSLLLLQFVVCPSAVQLDISSRVSYDCLMLSSATTCQEYSNNFVEPPLLMLKVAARTIGR